MGQVLDQWLAANSERLSTMAGRPPPVMPGMPGAPQGPAFGAPQPAAQASPAFAQGASPGTGPGFPAGDALPPGGAAPAFEAQAPQAAPVSVVSPEKKPTAAPKPRAKKNGNSFADLYGKADSNQINKAIDMLEEQTGQPIEALYQQQTGHPPPRNTKREKIGEFLFEFGLNLLASPAGQSSVENVGRSAISALETGRARDREHAAGTVAAEDRKIAAQERREGRLDKAFDRAATIERLEIERKQVENQIGRSVGKFDNYVGEDGYLYTYNEATGEARRVMANGKPVKPDPKRTRGEGKGFEWEVKYNRYLEVFGSTTDGQKLEGKDRRKVEEKAFEYANRSNPYTDAEAQRDAVKFATSSLTNDLDYKFADPEERKKMREKLTSEYKEALFPSREEVGGGGEPDVSKLSEGMATPVTDENGETVYWTLEDGKPRKVSAEELGQ